MITSVSIVTIAAVLLFLAARLRHLERLIVLTHQHHERCAQTLADINARLAALAALPQTQLNSSRQTTSQ